jgi:transcriptional activator of cad operon
MLGDDSHDPTYIETVPQRGYRLIAPVAPWVDAPHTPLENPQRPADEPARATLAVTRTGSPRRRVAIALSIVPTLALGYVVADRSIAVLPFVDMSEKKDQEHFADGMSEEIITAGAWRRVGFPDRRDLRYALQLRPGI